MDFSGFEWLRRKCPTLLMECVSLPGKRAECYPAGNQFSPNYPMNTAPPLCPPADVRLPAADPWRGFAAGEWRDEIDVRDFIQKNVTPYSGDEAFLKKPTTSTEALWGIVKDLLAREIAAGGVLDADTKVV